MQHLRDSIGSSPLAPPGGRSGTPLGLPSSPTRPEHSHSSSTAPRKQLNPRKRPSEDQTQYVNTVAHTLKLRRVDKDELTRVAKASAAEQRVWMAGMLLKVQEHNESMTGPDVAWQIPSKIVKLIKRKAIYMLLDPVLPSYIDVPHDPKNIGPAQALLKYLEVNSKHGYTAALAEDTDKSSIVLGACRDAFTRRRSRVKELIDKSFELCADPTKKQPGAKDIVDLTEEILLLAGKGSGIQISIEHCGRVAFLRCIAATIKQTKKNAYWKVVDDELKETRALSANKQSKFIKSLLEADRETYGPKAGTDAKVDEEVTKEHADTQSDLEISEGEGEQEDELDPDQ